MSGTYYFDESWPEERARLAALEIALDPGTVAHLEALPVQAGDRCAELGAGGGSIAAWLCERVGTGGHVLACDTQTKFVSALDHTQLEIVQHDISEPAIPGSGFDLVHVRWTLFWLSAEGRARALTAMVDSLKPGGWLLAEEPDFLTLLQSPLPEPLRTVIIEHVNVITALSRQADVFYGRNLFLDILRLPVEDLVTAGRTHVIQPQVQATGAPWLRFALERVRDQLVSSGRVSPSQFDEAMGQFDAPSTALLFPLTVAVRGRSS